MGYAYNGDIVLKTPLTVESNRPLDNRTVVRKEEDLLTISALYAYEGMLVSVLETGNTYMLNDISRINDRTGWKASYEAILIVPCTQEEYETWKENTYFDDHIHSDWTAKDPSKNWLLAEAYYYIYEDSITFDDDTQRYVRESDFIKYSEEVSENTLKIFEIEGKLNSDITNLSENYYTSEQTNNTFIKQEWIVKEEGLPSILSDYVTKEDLKGPGSEDEDYKFVTQTLYTSDKAELEILNQNLASSLELKANLTEVDLKVNTSDLQLLVTTLKLNLNSVEIISESNTLKVGNNLLAKEEDVPKMECLTTSEYLNRLDGDLLEKDTYYLTYEEQEDLNLSYATTSSSNLLYYYTKEEVDDKLAALKLELLTLINS